MKPFVFQHAQDLWPEGESLLHVYICPREQDRELTALVTRAHDTLKDFPITPVALPWLHITVLINRSREESQVRRLTWSPAC